MASYRVFEFENALPDDIQEGKNVVIIRDGFSLLALIFPLLWLLWHRLWVGFFVFLCLFCGIILIAEHYNPLLAILLNNLLGLYIGLEGNNWRAHKLSSHGWKEVDVVLAGDYEEADVKAFHNRDISRQTEGTREDKGAADHPGRSARIWPASRASRRPRAVIGSFPMPPSRPRS